MSFYTHNNENRRYELPANPPVDTRRKANHIFYIIAKSFCSVDPTHSDCFR